MTLTIKLDGNWSSFQLANNTPPLSVTGSVIAPSARMSPGGAQKTTNKAQRTPHCFRVLACQPVHDQASRDSVRGCAVETAGLLHSIAGGMLPRPLTASQRSLHYAPIFRLLLKVAVKGTHQCDLLNFCGGFWSPTICFSILNFSVFSFRTCSISML